VAGLLPEIKSKIVGCEGDFNQLLARARFEEAKLRDLGPSQLAPVPPQSPVTQGERFGQKPATSTTWWNQIQYRTVML